MFSEANMSRRRGDEGTRVRVSGGLEEDSAQTMVSACAHPSARSQGALTS